MSGRLFCGRCGPSSLLLATVLSCGSVVALATATGCAPEQKRARSAAEFEAQAGRAYQEAMLEYDDASWEFATQKFTELRRNYPNTQYALKAQMRLADILYEQGRYPEAVSLYKTYVSEHPTDREVAYARFRVIESQFETSSNTFFQPPLEERDLATVAEAYSDIRAFQADYPNYERQSELRYMLQAASGMLVRHELYVARFYLNRDEFDAAQRRVQYALRTYSNTGLEPEAVVLLGEIYLKEKRLAEAAAMFRHVVEQFPDSAFLVPAQRFLAKMDAGQPTAEQTQAERSEIPGTLQAGSQTPAAERSPAL